jgi:hypothetical protein
MHIGSFVFLDSKSLSLCFEDYILKTHKLIELKAINDLYIYSLIFDVHINIYLNAGNLKIITQVINMKLFNTKVLNILFAMLLMSMSAVADSNISKEDEVKSFSDYDAIAEALQPYIKSAKTGNGKVIRTAFYEHAHIVGSINGTLYNSDLNAFEKSVNAVGPAPDVQHHIAWIDISGPAAAAKVEFINWGGFRFTDFFILYKDEGQWKISGKVYDSHSQN